jgi:hypothetical protein
VLFAPLVPLPARVGRGIGRAGGIAPHAGSIPSQVSSVFGIPGGLQRSFAMSSRREAHWWCWHGGGIQSFPYCCYY